MRGRYAVARLDASAPVPSWPRGDLVSITRTPDELSIVCDEDAVPLSGAGEGADVPRSVEHGWRCLAVEGPIPFEMTGVAASLTNALADARISVFVLSTFDTDYVLVKDEAFERACDALRAAGHDVD
jgi:hypothetical protein